MSAVSDLRPLDAMSHAASAMMNIGSGSIGLIGTGMGLYALKKGRDAYKHIKTHGAENVALNLLDKGQ